MREGARGPAVEDIQRRLLILGFDIGPTGVDGVFLGRTLTAVREFQGSQGVLEDGIVGPKTWSALVDATFTLGDRLLYLRFPYLHGHDVISLQGILNALGFMCGPVDGIFGAYSERAVREFQLNVGRPVDGIVGADTVKAMMNLRHVWEGKDPKAPVSCRLVPARAAETLARSRVAIHWDGDTAEQISKRVSNLARAIQPEHRLEVLAPDEIACGHDLVVTIVSSADRVRVEGVPVVVPDEPAETLATRLLTAIDAGREEGTEVVVDVSGADPGDEHVMQAVTVGLLDGICAGLV